jgi:hypothetical protein
MQLYGLQPSFAIRLKTMKKFANRGFEKKLATIRHFR